MPYSQDEIELTTGQQAFSKPNNQFWTLQFFGWVGYFVIVFLAIVHPQWEAPDFNFKGQMLNLGVETLAGFVLSSCLWFLIRRIMHLSLRITLFISFLSAAALGVLFNGIKLASFKILVYGQSWNEKWSLLEFGGWLLFSVATLFAFTAIFFIMLYNIRLQKEHEKLLRARTSAKEAQLQMLRYQLNPHFMFNTLNAISTLIYKYENEKANEMLDKLCAFFRQSLSNKGDNVTSLKEEIELLELYLSIEKVRFGDRLQVNLDIDPASLTAKVPGMFLQPLVENAIKYGIESKKEAGQIWVKVKKTQKQLLIEVIDNGVGPSNEDHKGFGIGLQNTKERLNTLFNDQCTVNLTESEFGGALVTVKIPFNNV